VKPKLIIEITAICLIIFLVTYLLPVHFRELFVTENETIKIMGLPVGLILIAGFLLRIRFMRWVLLFLFGAATFGLAISLFVQDNPQPGFFIVVFLNLILITILIYSKDLKVFLSRKPRK
jgi:hypothetical protein